MANAIEVEGVKKRFGDFDAVNGISFSVEQGQIFAFLGPNGAGKTTTIKMLTTVLAPSEGRLLIAGHAPVKEPLQVRSVFGIVFQDPSLDDELTAAENMELHGVLYGVARAKRRLRIEALLRLVDLWDRRGDYVKRFSGGMKRRLEIARALQHRPRILFLDEPTVGLDPQTRSSIWSYINDLKAREDITIFLTTHYMDEAENCDRIAIIDHGKIVAIDTPEALKASVGKDRVQIQTADDATAIAALADLFGIEAAIHEGSVTFSVSSGEQFVPRLFAELAIPIRSVSVSRPSLDDVFMSYTGSTIRDAEASGSDAMRQMAARWRGGRR
jgi:ABC-2 type transport system ATP-binding protein